MVSRVLRDFAGGEQTVVFNDEAHHCYQDRPATTPAGGPASQTREDLEAVNAVTLDGIGGNTWEQLLTNACERDARVAAYAKNDHLGFSIPYVHQGRSHSYLPDFLIRLARRDGDVERTLVVEVSGGQKSPGPTAAKADTARDQWCVAVNNHGGFGRWGYVEITSMNRVREQLAEAIDLLYADAPIVGDPSLLDYNDSDRAARPAHTVVETTTSG